MGVQTCTGKWACKRVPENGRANVYRKRGVQTCTGKGCLKTGKMGGCCEKGDELSAYTTAANCLKSWPNVNIAVTICTARPLIGKETAVLSARKSG